MDIQYSNPDNYPVVKNVMFSDNEVVPIGVADTPVERLRDFLFAKFGFNADGELNEITDQFHADLFKVIQQYAKAQSFTEVTAMGRFSSTDENPQYAGGVVSDGNRIFTPQEAAIKTLESIKEI